MKWTITTPPATEPITETQAKYQARIDSNDEYIWIEEVAIPAVRASAEAEAQVSLITQTITLNVYDHHEAHRGLIKLPRGPVQSVTSITDGNNATVDPANYVLERVGLNDFIKLKRDPPFPLTIVYVAGFGAGPADIPADLRSMMLAHFTFLFENRSADVDPTALDRIYRRYRSFAG